MTTGDEKVVVDFTKGVSAKDLALFKAEVALVTLQGVKPLRQALIELWVQQGRAAGMRLADIHEIIAKKLDVEPETVETYLKRFRRRSRR